MQRSGAAFTIFMFKIVKMSLVVTNKHKIAIAGLIHLTNVSLHQLSGKFFIISVAFLLVF